MSCAYPQGKGIFIKKRLKRECSKKLYVKKTSYLKGGVKKMKTKDELKIWIAMAVFMALISISVFVGSASANTIYVPDNYAKIQWAVDNATDGDTIVVRDGTFVREDIIFKKLMLIVSITKEGYLYVKTGWEV